MIYMLNWVPDLRLVEAAGAKIAPQADGTVEWVDPLATPGAAIYQWHGGFGEHKPVTGPCMPLLMPKRAYRLAGEWTATPAGTVGLAVESYSKQGVRLDRIVGDQKTLDFTLAPEDMNYAVQLVSLSATALRFHQLVLAEADTLAAYAIHMHARDFCVVTPREQTELPLVIQLQPKQQWIAGFVPQPAAECVYIPTPPHCGDSATWVRKRLEALRACFGTQRLQQAQWGAQTRALRPYVKTMLELLETAGDQAVDDGRR